jgi:hypothetical protein
VEVRGELRLGGDRGAALGEQRNELRRGARRIAFVVANDGERCVDEREERLSVLHPQFDQIC